MVSNHFVAFIKGPEKTGPPEYTIGFNPECIRYRPYQLPVRNLNHKSIETSLIGGIISLAISITSLMWLVATSRGLSFVPSKAIAGSLFL